MNTFCFLIMQTLLKFPLHVGYKNMTISRKCEAFWRLQPVVTDPPGPAAGPGRGCIGGRPSRPSRPPHPAVSRPPGPAVSRPPPGLPGPLRPVFPVDPSRPHRPQLRQQFPCPPMLPGKAEHQRVYSGSWPGNMKEEAAVEIDPAAIYLVNVRRGSKSGAHNWILM